MDSATSFLTLAWIHSLVVIDVPAPQKYLINGVLSDWPPLQSSDSTRSPFGSSDPQNFLSQRPTFSNLYSPPYVSFLARSSRVHRVLDPDQFDLRRFITSKSIFTTNTLLYARSIYEVYSMIYFGLDSPSISLNLRLEGKYYPNMDYTAVLVGPHPRSQTSEGVLSLRNAFYATRFLGLS
ncbi:uncharacterized protein BT62DRAFT_1012833 [Guyanagaster necrorhizus]|uniref:Uncharacterized protein n=1 Tax=Guyanagaster necrorhizus TaxID=856835 RepID=A0A9P8ALZ4_9AGAR|nr:uncharacterized protein BT62DRAFT_1012833 [Guyanagaster necrorhizus MCA 3950]KAG7440330.1 hypothetical protein BT62DRAFT_1012833 [Guyanagaster necrorhizus MCA 3950]